MSCIDDYQLVDPRIGRLLTQYRESPNLKYVIRNYLRQIEEAAQILCAMPDFFDIDSAVGDQLTLLGKRLGFPREHCICESPAVFGFACNEENDMNILGFCEDVTFIDCKSPGVSFVEITSDDLYRKFLISRIYQTQAYFDSESLKTVVRMFFGEQALVLDRRRGRVIIAPGRPLTPQEQAIIQLYPRVLPVSLGISVRFHFDTITAVFGFGEGWKGFCQGDRGAGEPLTGEDDDPLLTEAGQGILSDTPFTEPYWMCATDVKAYDC